MPPPEPSHTQIVPSWVGIRRLVRPSPGSMKATGVSASAVTGKSEKTTSGETATGAAGLQTVAHETA
ncbi:MAG TPA: hypothetical protein VMT85_15055 [Thermoanaerobaculia bacterium]|nr:hypothetical protein [Thermoanaerobaculia bacterium]